MQHGYEFNERKEEILAGKRFEQHSIAAEEEEYGLYWRPRGVRSLAKRTTDERMQCIKRSAKWLETTFKIAGDIILQELLKKYCKYTNESEIESGFNLFLREKEGI